MIEADFVVVVSIFGDEAHAMTPERAREVQDAIVDKLAEEGSPLARLPGTFSIVVTM